MQAAGSLSTNLHLHAITVVLVFALARRRLDNAAALVAALVFAVQPANAEIVAYVSGRSTGPMTQLLLGGLLLYDQEKRFDALASGMAIGARPYQNVGRPHDNPASLRRSLA